MKRKYLFSLCMLFIVLTGTIYGNSNDNNTDYGLFIKAFPSSDQEKTTLILENNQPIKLNKEITMSFEMYVRKDNVFGVIFRMITDNNDNIDLIFTVGENDKRYPMLVINESVYLISQEVKCDEWIPVSITLSRQNNRVSMEYNGIRQAEEFSFSKVNNMHVSFGLCPFDKYILYDIASISIRDIKLFDGENLKRFWKLDKHKDNLSIDSIASVPVTTTNPKWITDIYATWENIYSEKIQENSLFAYNKKDNLIYIVSPDSKSIKVVNPEDKSAKTLMVKSGIISANAPNQIFYDDARNELVTYNLNENITARFSFESMSWNNHTKPTLEHSYTNNSVSFSEADSTFVAFGGYGFYKYNNEILRLDKDGKITKKSTLPDISPRYSASTTVVNNTLYILGGRGNKSGRQELSPKNTYDFYSVNLLTEQVNKLWEDENINTEFLPSENMIFDSNKNCFYVYTTKDGGMLMKVGTTQKGFEQMSFPIGEILSSHYLYTYLYFSPTEKKFYAVINKVYTDSSAEVNIYSLNYPPVAVSTIEDTITPLSDSEEKPFPFWTVFIAVAVLAVVGYIIYYFSGKNSGNKKEENDHLPGEKEKPQESQEPNIEKQSVRPEEETLIGGKTEKEETQCYDFTKSSICLLGGFYVSDKSGQNITGQFTPMLKYLLVLLILYTIKDPKGISGRKLIQMLWYDKSEDSAKNNRNVYMSKLRSLLESVGNAEIINQNGFWTIKLHDINCDYTEAMGFFSKIEKTEHLTPNEISSLLELLLRGVLLPNTEEDWTDSFKSDFSNQTIDVLTFLSGNESYKFADDMKLKIADTLFLHDYVNEEALYLKCSILYNSGKKGIAKTVYDNFRKEYEMLLGVDYKYTLQDVISRKNIEN